MNRPLSFDIALEIDYSKKELRYRLLQADQSRVV